MEVSTGRVGRLKSYQVDETHLGTNFPSLSSIPDPLCTLPFHKITLALSWLTNHFLKVLADDFSEAYGVTSVGAGRMKGRYADWHKEEHYSCHI